MNWEALWAIGEIVGAIAVVLTLGYLAAQIRQNTKTVRTSTYQAVLDYSSGFNELVLSNPHIWRIWKVGRLDPAQLTDEERSQFRLLVGQLFNIYETMLLQYQRGTLDQEYWDARLVGLRHLLSQPGLRTHWLRSREEGITPARVPAFQELMDSLVGLTSDPDGTNA